MPTGVLTREQREKSNNCNRSKDNSKHPWAVEGKLSSEITHFINDDYNEFIHSNNKCLSDNSESCGFEYWLGLKIR